jgi:hemin uptake protein HemP
MTPERREAPRTEPRESAKERVVQAEELLQGRPTLVIEYGGARYVLRTTRNGKLILTK